MYPSHMQGEEKTMLLMYYHTSQGEEFLNFKSIYYQTSAGKRKKCLVVERSA